MHADLVAISNLWAADSTIDRLRAEHEVLTAAVRGAMEQLTRAEAAIVAAGSLRDKVVADTRANDRELAGYVEKRDRTRKMIETGSAPDYAAAERQLAQCLAIVDELETKALELMEAADAAKSALATAEKEKEKIAGQLDAARRALAGRDGPIRAELTEAAVRSKVAAGELPDDYRVPYAELRRKKRPALINISATGTCSHCSTKLPAQKVVEAQMGRAVNACPGCGGWMLP
jgi:predicted  nucleic acid-binding Zn-ribbon protein